MSMPSDIPQMDLRVLYLAAGHTETSGLQTGGLSEGRENIEVVEDALRYLAAFGGLSAGRPLPGIGAEHDLGPVLLIQIDHALDLEATVAAINADYTARCQAWGLDALSWRWGICLEVHFNGPSPVRQGPTVVHGTDPASSALGSLAARAMSAAVGRPARHLDGHLFRFIRATFPLALLVECDEMANPARAMRIADAVADDIYGLGIARLLLRLSGVPDAGQPRKRGIHLPDPMPPNWWPEVDATGARGLVVFHASDVQPDGRYYLWRAWSPPPIWQHYPDGRAFALEVVQRLEVEGAGRPWPAGIQFLNEPNLKDENGLADGSLQAAERTLAWGQEVVQGLREYLGPDIEIHSPPLSPFIPGCLQFYEQMRPLVELCDVLNVHCYWNSAADLSGANAANAAFHYRRVAALFPDKPAFISECGREASGSKDYGQELAWYFDHLDDYVIAACPFIWYSPEPRFQKWVLRGTEAAGELVATAPA